MECILEANAQLFACLPRGKRSSLRYDQADDASLQEFARFVRYAEEALTITLPETLPRAELLQRLYVATYGVVGNLMNLLRYAAWLTRQQQQATIALPTLAAAFDKRLSKHLKNQPNPFTVAPGEPIAMTPIPQVPGAAPLKRKRRDSVAEVL